MLEFLNVIEMIVVYEGSENFQEVDNKQSL